MARRLPVPFRRAYQNIDGRFKVGDIWWAVEKGAREAGRDPSMIEKVGALSSSYARKRKRARVRLGTRREGSCSRRSTLKISTTPRRSKRESAKVTDEEIASRTLTGDNADDYIEAIGGGVKAARPRLCLELGTIARGLSRSLPSGGHPALQRKFFSSDLK